MSERYEKIRIIKGAAHSVLVEVEKGGVSFDCTLTAHEASLLARDLIRASMSATLGAPRIKPAPSTAADNSEIAALRRDMQQMARNQHAIAAAQKDHDERLKKIEALASVAHVDVNLTPEDWTRFQRVSPRLAP